MARDVESLVLLMSADLRKFEREMARSRQVADKRLTEVERRAIQSQKRLSQTMERAGRDMVSSLRSSLSAIAPTLAAAFSAQAVIQYADAWTSGRNALAAAGVATADLAARQSELVDIANESRTGAAETIALYQRLSIATKELGLSQQDTLRLTELLNKSFASGGLSTQEAASAALQLSQALASGSLQGDELRSLRENAPLVAKAISDSMGVGIGALKDLGAEGKITSDVIVKALFAASEQINKTFENAEITVGQALTRLNNNLGRFVGQSDDGLSATDRLAQGIVALADNLETVAQVVAAVAAVMGTRFVLAMTAGSGAMIANGVAAVRLAAFQTAMTASLTGTTTATVVATGAMRTFSAAIAANPIGAAIIATAALSSALIFLVDKTGQAQVAKRELDRAVAAADATTQEYSKALADAAAKTGEEREKALQLAAAIRETSQARINDIRLTAQQRVAEAAAARTAAMEARERVAASNRNRRPGDVGPNQVRTNNSLGLLAAENRLRRAETAANEAFDALKVADTALVAAASPAVSSMRSPAPADDKKKKAAGPTPEELAAQREMLALQGQLEMLRAQGREDEARSVQLQIDRINLEKQYSDAGVANAKEAARIQVEGVAQAEATQRDLDKLEEASERRTSARLAGRERETALLQDQLQQTAELARLEGDPAAIAAAERALWIEERINQLLALRPDLSTDARRAMAGAEASALEGAGLAGENRQRAEYEGREMARNFVDVLASDDIWTAAGNRFREAAFDNLEDLLSELFSGMNGGGEGGSLGSVLGNALKSLIPGFDSGGYTGAGGVKQPAGVVHKGEVVWSQADIARAGGVGVVEAMRRGMKGYANGGVVSIMPQVNAAMANMPSGGRGLTQVFQVNAQGAIMAEGLVSELKASGAQMAMQAGVTAYGRAKADTMSDLSRRQEYSVR